MSRILQINSSARRVVDGQGSVSTRLAQELVVRLQAQQPGSELTVRDLALQPHPVLDEAALQALFTPAEQRSPEQAARVALDDALIAEAQAADVLVIGSPMINFGVSAQLKNWIDAISRVRVTFQYTANGPEGLLKNKKVYVAAARGGVYEEAQDPQVPQMRALLGFLGLVDQTYIYSSGMAMGPDAVAAGQAAANAAIEAALA